MEIKAIKQVSLTESISDLGSRHFYFLPGEIAEVEHAKYKVVKEQKHYYTFTRSNQGDLSYFL